jgi:aminobenzoyl-glutamate utilization protein B
LKKERLYQLIDGKRSQWTALSDFIWEHPETRYEEIESSAALRGALSKEGFQVEDLHKVIPCAFVGTWGEGGPVIGFLGEYDALGSLSQVAGIAERKAIVQGGHGHGCCHHLLGTGALAAAVALRDFVKEENIPCTIKYFGCPGEEGGSGKAFMAREGIFNGIDVAITWHGNATTNVWTGSSLANIQVYFKFIGRASHAGASPHLGRSALDAVELMNVGVQYLREHIITEARVHYALINAGGKSPNVVQPEAEVLYLIRAPKNNLVQDVYKRVCDIARGAALMTGTQMTIQVDKACSNLIVNETLEKVMAENLTQFPMRAPSAEEIRFAEAIQETLSDEEKGGTLKALINVYGEKEGKKLAAKMLVHPISSMALPYLPNDKSSSGSTDVSDVSWIAPTVQVRVSCYALNTPGHSWQQVAQGKLAWAHDGMLNAAKAMAGTGLDLILNPEVLKEAKLELLERTGPEGYQCPIPKGINPSPVK